jgi:hypothetical protein
MNTIVTTHGNVGNNDASIYIYEKKRKRRIKQDNHIKRKTEEAIMYCESNNGWRTTYRPSVILGRVLEAQDVELVLEEPGQALRELEQQAELVVEAVHLL